LPIRKFVDGVRCLTALALSSQAELSKHKRLYLIAMHNAILTTYGWSCAYGMQTSGGGHPVVSSVAARLRGLRLRAPRGWAPTFSLALTLLIHPANAEDSSPELIQPLICSAETAYQPALKGLCEVTSRDDGHTGNKVKVNLTANSGRIEVGGYSVVTEHYNGTYVPPVVRANPGDIVAAHLENLLAPRKQLDGHEDMAHGDASENPTNLHYFHGGIVTPRNARPPLDASEGTGDNVYVHLKAGRDVEGKPNSFEFEVPIAGEGELDARVLEGEGNQPKIAHPLGLNWYHSHLHGISSDQVMGGLSGLLSVGDDDANVKAACKEDPSHKAKCLNDVDNDTSELKKKTDVRYALLRDISLRAISALPEEANGAAAVWAPEDRDFPPEEGPKPRKCPVWKKDSSGVDNNPKFRKGFCQRSEDTAWLFTLNGQRFPTITVEGGRNVLLRMGNVSANVAYWLELQNERDEKDILKLTILGLDGVVPAKPVAPGQAKIPVAAFDLPDLLLMPASRAEIYVRNDVKAHSDTQVYILRTKGLNAGTDWWPEIQLARIVLKPNAEANPTLVALNAPIAQTRLTEIKPFAMGKATLPKGCVRDLDPTKGEHRRVTFSQEMPEGLDADWSVKTEIVHPPAEAGLFEEKKFQPSDTDDEKTTIGPIPFETYEQAGGSIDWEGEHNRHVCIRLDPGGTSHKQLWVLVNGTESLHNFHIHQMKFRLATHKELEDHDIKPPDRSHTCQGATDPCGRPDFKFYDESEADRPEAEPVWHDTIPVPPGRVFLIMSFDAQQQVGRFVFHCHILKHEDRGLMAPIEVWNP